MAGRRSAIQPEYLENAEACVRTAESKPIRCSGRRRRGDGYETDDPTPGRSVRLYDVERDPGGAGVETAIDWYLQPRDEAA